MITDTLGLRALHKDMCCTRIDVLHKDRCADIGMSYKDRCADIGMSWRRNRPVDFFLFLHMMYLLSLEVSLTG